MTQKTKPKKRGAFTSRDEEINRLKERLNDFESEKRLKPLIDSFLQHVGVLAAYTPYSKWPPMLRSAFDSVGSRMPTARHEYLERNAKFALSI